MKQSKKAVSLLLTLVLCLGLTVPAMAAGSTFTDVPASHWAYHDIEGMVARNVVEGLGDGRFDPDGKVTCANFSAMLARLFFEDELAKRLNQPNDYWWQPYTDTLMELKAFDFTDIKGSYRDNGEKWDKAVVEAPLSRFKMAQIMDNVMGLKGALFPTPEETADARKEIADLASFPVQYIDAVVNMYTMGCLQGMDPAGNFQGEEQMNRAQACTVLTRMVNILENPSPDDIPDLNFDGVESELTLEVGTAHAFSVAGLPRGAKLEAVSSDTNVVMCSDGGGINAVAPGVAQVTYTARLGNKSAQKTVTVTVVATEGSEPGSDLQAMREEMLARINKEREAEGRGPLALDDTLCQAAQVRAEEITQSFSHTRPDGRSCYTAIDEAGVSYRAAGENIAAGQRSVAAVMDGWMNSSGHRSNILSGDFGRVGIGCAYANDSYGIYWVQMFVN